MLHILQTVLHMLQTELNKTNTTSPFVRNVHITQYDVIVLTCNKSEN